MKKSLFFITVFLGVFIFATSAQKVVSLHHEGAITSYYQADGFQKAYADAIDGDTIVLPGGSFAPPSALEKQLTIFGAGHYAASDTPTGKTVINDNINLKPGGDNLHFEGLYIYGSMYSTAGESVHNLTFKRCFFNSSITFPGDRVTNPCNNIAFIQCVLNGQVTLSNAKNVGIYNSLLASNLNYSEASAIKNNIFLINGYTIVNGVNNTLEGNIFCVNNGNYLTRYCEGNTFNYNISKESNPYYGDNPQLTGNWEGIDFSTLFVNQTGFTFSYEHDYHLNVPGDYLDGDGLQAGIYGGIFPYKPDAVPVIPHIKSKTISSTSDENGMIQVNIEVEAQDE